MSDKTKLVSMIVLVLIGLMIALWGVLWILFKRRDDKVLTALKADNLITAEQYKKVTPSLWAWGLSIVQIVLGVFLMGWGIFQYFSKVEKLQEFGQQNVERLKSYFKEGSRRAELPNTPLPNTALPNVGHAMYNY